MFNLSLVFLLLWGCQYAAGSPIMVTEYEYVREADAWLRLHIVPAVWSDAAILCQLEGGVLASPTTNATAQAMLNTMMKHKLTSKRVFVGATRLFSEGDLKSPDGKDFTNNYLWARREPDNVKDCLALTGAGALTDVSCARALPYFCRKSPQDFLTTKVNKKSLLPTSQCGEVGHVFEEQTGSCYKFHRLAQPWRTAMATCHAEGGHLAIINDQWESAVLANICANGMNSSDVIGAESRDRCLIGFRKWDNEAWGTIYGETPAKIKMFLPNVHNTESCGAIYRNGGITAVKCTKPYVYICEISPVDKCNVRTFWAD